MVPRAETGASVATVDLSGRTALVTGATSGIGREIALALGRLGARVLAHGRDRDRGRAVVDALAAGGSPAPSFFPADFEDQSAVEALAAWTLDEAEAVDLLVHNAGTHRRRGRLNAAGIERTVAVNHLAPFVLTRRLLGGFPADGRIVVVASKSHRQVDLDLRTFTDVSGYDGSEAYARSKLANVLFVRALARRLDGPTANALHPGFVPGTAIGRDAPWYSRAVVWALAQVPRVVPTRYIERPATGAETAVFLAASPTVADVTGAYFVDCEPVPPAPIATDDALAAALWRESERLTGVDWPAS